MKNFLKIMLIMLMSIGAVGLCFSFADVFDSGGSVKPTPTPTPVEPNNPDNPSVKPGDQTEPEKPVEPSNPDVPDKPVEPIDVELLGTWNFNPTIKDTLTDASQRIVYKINFHSDVYKFDQLVRSDYSLSGHLVGHKDFEFSAIYLYSNNTFDKEVYKSIEITSVKNCTNKDSLLSFLKSNAVKAVK